MNMAISEVEALSLLLEDWVEWCKLFKEKTGYPKKSAGFATGGINCYDDMEDSIKNDKYDSLTAAVKDLYDENQVYAAAIYMRYGISRVFRFPRDNFEQTLILAHDRLVIICKRKGIVL